MSYYFKNIKPGVESESDEGEDLERLLRKNNHDDAEESSDDELRTLSFGSLKKADTMMDEEDNGHRSKSNGKSKNKPKPKTKAKEEYIEKEFKSESELESGSESESGSSDSEFFEEESSNKGKDKKQKKKNKHAPSEQSAKKPVSKTREIPGLHTSKNKNSKLYQDIRFDKSTGGPIDSSIIRRRYGFLDEYREREIEEMESMLKDRKLISKLPPQEIESIEKRLQSTKSRLQTMKSRDLERNIVKDYEDSFNKDNKNKFHLKRSEKRKLVQKWKFDHMKSKQRERIMERKRKKRLGKEFKQFEFNK